MQIIFLLHYHFFPFNFSSFSSFPFPHFPHFPFFYLFFLASFFPISCQKFPGGKSLGGTLSPHPHLLCHWSLERQTSLGGRLCCLKFTGEFYIALHRGLKESRDRAQFGKITTYRECQTESNK